MVRTGHQLLSAALAKLPENGRLPLDPAIKEELALVYRKLTDDWPSVAQTLGLPLLPDEAVLTKPIRVTIAAKKEKVRPTRRLVVVFGGSTRMVIVHGVTREGGGHAGILPASSRVRPNHDYRQHRPHRSQECSRVRTNGNEGKRKTKDRVTRQSHVIPHDRKFFIHDCSVLSVLNAMKSPRDIQQHQSLCVSRKQTYTPQGIYP